MRRFLSCLAYLSFVLLTVRAQVGRQGTTFATPQSHFVEPVAQQQTLSAEGSSALQTLINAGHLEILHWPDFMNYRSSVLEFYGRNGYALAWMNDNELTAQALSLITNLQQADHKGLNPEDYDGPIWSNRLARLQQVPSPAAADRVAFDVALTVSAMRYASDLNVGRVAPRLVNCEYDVEQNRCDLAEFLSRVARAEDVSAVFRELDPPFEIYRRTEKALQTYLMLADDHDEVALAPMRVTIKPGDSYPDVPKLAHLLRKFGDMPAAEVAMISDPAGSPIYQGKLVEAVRRFQRRHGLEDNGWITKKTISELNVPLAQRVEELQFALERLRWAPRRYSQPPIVVNIPEFTLRALDEHYTSALVTNVVVGKAYRHRTPVFEGTMKYLIFRPYWDVPHSITTAELLPHVSRNRDYLNEHNYEIVARDGSVIGAEVSEDIGRQLRSGQLRIRQRPGNDNALGLVKFVFPNEHDVYLHSTPAPELFAKSRRDFSHGCIRVQHAEELAAWVLRGKPGWDIDRIRAAMTGTQTLRVELEQPIPVLIFYSTAVVSKTGEVHFLDDIYGYDAELKRMLANRFRSPE